MGALRAGGFCESVERCSLVVWAGEVGHHLCFVNLFRVTGIELAVFFVHPRDTTVLHGRGRSTDMKSAFTSAIVAIAGFLCAADSARAAWIFRTVALAGDQAPGA